MINEPRKKLRLIIKFKKRGQPTGIFMLPQNILYEEILLRVVQQENGFRYAESLRKVCQSFKQFLCEDYVLKRMNFWNAPIIVPACGRERKFYEKYVDACVDVGNPSAMYIACMTTLCFLFPQILKIPSLQGIVDLNPQTIYLHSMLTFSEIRLRQAASESLQALLISSTKPNIEKEQTSRKSLPKEVPFILRKPNLADYAVDIVLKLIPRSEDWSMMPPLMYTCPLSPTCCREQTTVSRSGRRRVFMDACSISCRVYLEYEYFRVAQILNLNVATEVAIPHHPDGIRKYCNLSLYGQNW